MIIETEARRAIAMSYEDRNDHQTPRSVSDWTVPQPDVRDKAPARQSRVHSRID